MPQIFVAQLLHQIQKYSPQCWILKENLFLFLSNTLIYQIDFCPKSNTLTSGSQMNNTPISLNY